MQQQQAVLWALATVGVFAAAAKRVAMVVLGHTHHRALGAVAVTLVLVVLAVGLGRIGGRMAGLRLPGAVAVGCACAGALYLGSLLSAAMS